MEKKYSKVYPTDGEHYIGFRYNYTYGVLEYVSKIDFDFTGKNKLVEIELPDWQVISSIGLSREDWKESPDYWIEHYKTELDAESAAIFEMEFGVGITPEQPYCPSATAGDYSPSNPWDAPGMNVRDFI